MVDRPSGLPVAAQAAARRGDRIEAIRLMREHTGLGLAEAKAAVDAFLAGTDTDTDAAPAATGIPLKAVLALRSGSLIDAVRHTRQATGLGMKDAKDAVTQYLALDPAVRALFDAAARATFRRVAGRALLLLALTALVAMGYLYLSGSPG